MTVRVQFPSALLVAAAVACGLLISGVASPANAASQVEAVVNRQAITSYDISRRVNFLKLQRTKGNLRKMARDQMIEQTLKMQEISRLGATASDEEVNAAFKRFADSNKLSTSQLKTILQRAHVGADHFKAFIRVQMSWPRVVKARYGGELSNQDLVTKMLEKGDKKPSTTEYVLQQVIFVVPKSKRNAILGSRKREARAMRGRFQNCDTTRGFAAKLRDVSVRDLGRVMQPELPPAWKSEVEKASPGEATPVRVTDRGVEFIGVCSSRTVSDDLAAKTVFKAESESDSESSADSKKFLAELRKRATITQR